LLEAGLDLLETELDRQVLSDGAHEERSPMYHAQLLQDLLLLGALLEKPPAFLAQTVLRMTQFLTAISHPDGEIPLFGDAVLGEALPPPVLRELAERTLEVSVRPPVGSFSLPRAGFHVLGARDQQARMIVKAGVPGPAHQLGHAHCDAFSYELSLGPLRMIVDSGVHGYAESPYRAFCRSTRAHNTVQINDEEQLECWGAFRVGRRYTWMGATWEEYTRGARLSGSYQLPSGTRHQRTIHFEPPVWKVLDEIQGRGPVSAWSFVHFHPDVVVTPNGAGWLAERGALRLGVTPLGEVSGELQRGGDGPVENWYFPRFGTGLRGFVLALHAEGTGRLDFGYLLHVNPELPLAAVPLSQVPG
jgi:hypothetical protein